MSPRDDNALEHTNSALHDVRLGRQCEGNVNESFPVIIAFNNISFDDNPQLLRARVLRGLGHLQAARMETDIAMKTQIPGWQSLWFLGDMLAEEAGICDTQPSRSQHLQNPSCQITNTTSLNSATDIIFKALLAAADMEALEHVPLDLVMRYGDIQLVQLHRNRAARDCGLPIPHQHEDVILKHATEFCHFFHSMHRERLLEEAALSSHVSALAGIASLQAR